MLNFNHLYYFYITAKAGSTTLASHRLSVSQPSLSSQLKVLEDSLNVKLFRRVGRNNHLSEAGSVVYGYCRRMFEVSEELKELIIEKLPTASRRINIGVSNEVEQSFVVEVVSLFLKKIGTAHRPKISMVSGSHEQLTDKLKFREIDALVTPVMMSDPELMNLVRAETPVSLFCSKNQKVPHGVRFQKSPPALRAMVGENKANWVLPSAKFKLRSEIDSFFEKNELKGRIIFESDVVESLVRSVSDEIGFAFIPLLYVGKEVLKKYLKVLGPKEGFWKYRVWLGCHNQNREDALIQSLSHSFKEVCDQFS